MKLNFRNLRADEIDVRVAKVSEKGVQLLLYKNARVDMNILDETVGQDRWARDHFELKNNIYCKVGIKCGDEWVWKADAGAESYSDAEKGEASDSFKRACFNWGIGRELYTAPFIWVSAADVVIEENAKGKLECKSRFEVKEIETEGKVITGVSVMNTKTHKTVYSFGTVGGYMPKPAPSVPLNMLKVPCARCGKETDIALMKKAKNNKTGEVMDICPNCARECGI